MTYSYGRALQQSALKFWSKNIDDLEGTQKFLIIELKCVLWLLKENGLAILKINKKNLFILSLQIK